ncbi:MAG: hypothetical protein JXA99_07670, partial [Candidatus Lokiarchaeota archaeon]|nr:hypothetical protein [Candidatus Lokiarchaeota archaeon]
MEKNKLIIRHPTLNELNDIASIIYHGFYDKFSFLFKENVKLGEIIFKYFFSKIYKENTLKRFLIAFQREKIIGAIEIHTKSKLPPLIHIYSLFFLLWKYFGFFKAFKKILVIFFMATEKVERKSTYISLFSVKPDYRNQGVVELPNLEGFGFLIPRPLPQLNEVLHDLQR